MTDGLGNRKAEFAIWHCLAFLERSPVVAPTRAQHHHNVVSFSAGSAPNSPGGFLELGIEVAHSDSAKAERRITVGDEEKGVGANPQAPPTDAHDEVE